MQLQILIHQIDNIDVSPFKKINIKKNIKDKPSSIKNIKAFIHNDKLPTLRFKRYNESKEDIKIILTGLKNDKNNIEEYKKSFIFIVVTPDQWAMIN